MPKQKLREAIAAEAARLIYRGKEQEYYAARKRAARWLSRRKLAPEDMPTNAEIQIELYALAGLFHEERETAGLIRMREAARELMEMLHEFEPRLSGCALEGPAMTGSDIRLLVSTPSARRVAAVLESEGFHPRLARPARREDSEAAGDSDASGDDIPAGRGGRPQGAEVEPPRLKLHYHFPCEIIVLPPGSPDAREGIDLDGVKRLLRETMQLRLDATSDEPGNEESAHPDAFGAMQLLVESLASVRLDPGRHPEGDALYHTMQVFELGREERPYDEEFLLACLLHDVGLAIDRRNSVRAAVESLGDLITERTRFLIEFRKDAAEYLRTGKISRSLMRSEHFEDLLLLARCDIAGRVCGAQVSTPEEAFDYIAGLEGEWE